MRFSFCRAQGFTLIRLVSAPDIDMSAAWGGMLVFDALVFALTLGHALTARARRHARRDLASVIIYDGARLILWPWHLPMSSLARLFLPLRNDVLCVRTSRLFVRVAQLLTWI